MCIVSYSTINNLQTWIDRSNLPPFISKAKCKYLRILKIHDIRDKISCKTATMVAIILNTKKIILGIALKTEIFSIKYFIAS